MVLLLSATSISRHGAVTGSNQKCAKVTVLGRHVDFHGV